MQLMGLDFSISSLVAGFVFGVFGLYLVKDFKKTGSFLQLFMGLGLMVYPYFVTGAFLTWIVGGGMLFVALAYGRRA